MPNPKLYLAAFAAAVFVSAAVAWVARRCRLPANAVCVPALAAGVLCGAWLLKLPLAWPPSNGLGRLLSVVLPAAALVEVLAQAVSGARWFGWCARLTLAVLVPRIVLDGSVYLSGELPRWSATQAALVCLASGALLAAVWLALELLARRSGGVSLPLALAEAALCGGLTIMLKGYLAGGEAGLPLAGALTGCALATVALKLPNESSAGAIGVAVVMLFGLLFVGHFFGQLSTTRMLVLSLAPLLCWISECKAVRQRPPWQIGLLRLTLVAAGLAMVVLLAKSEFDRDTRPLL